MKNIFINALMVSLLAVASTASSQTPAHHWSERFGGSGSDIGNSVAVDGRGNIVVTGTFTGTANFGGADLASAGGTDIFLAKYNTAGAHVWSERFGGTGNDAGAAVAVATDFLDVIFLTGNFSGTVDFGGGSLVSAGSTDIFLARYNELGGHLDSKRFGSTGLDAGLDVEVFDFRAVVTGYFDGTVNFGGSNLVSAGGSDIFVAKYTAGSLSYASSARFGGTGSDMGACVAGDPTNNVLVAGSFNGTVDFGGGNLVSAGDADIYLAKYNSTGVHQWSRRFGGISTDSGSAIAVDGAGNALISGSFAGTVDFGGGNLTSIGTDVFLAKYNSAGLHQWSKRLGGNGSDFGDAVATDESGNVVVTGKFSGTADFGGGNLPIFGADDIFLVKYNADGMHTWSRGFGGTLFDEGKGLAVDAAGNVIATGYFVGSANFGGGNLVGTGNEIYLARFGSELATPLITSITDIGNDQGRNVRIRFVHSGLDAAGSGNPIAEYVAYRRDDAPPSSSVSSAPGDFRAEGWTEVGTVRAFEEDSYGIDVPTVGDSTVALGQYYSVFFVRAATADAGTFFDSPPDSGYSLDNLAPGVPNGFVYANGILSWSKSSASDFEHFTVYGSHANSFGLATLIDHTLLPELDVNTSLYEFYFVTATDVSGNEGAPALVNALPGADGTQVRFVLSISAYPNPFNPRTTIRYTVPSKGRVTVDVYDARGARVASLFDGEQPAGAYTRQWEGRNDAGETVASGVYLARVTHSAGTRTYKLTLLK